MQVEKTDHWNDESLCTELHQRGLRCDHYEDSEALTDLTLIPGRLILTERDADEKHGSGITFWLHAAAQRVFVGLWSGLIYEVSAAQRTPELAEAMMNGTYLRKGDTPRFLPPEAIAEYGLRRREFFWILPPDAPACMYDPSVERMEPTVVPLDVLHAIAPAVDRCERDELNFVHVYVGATHAIWRLPPEPDRALRKLMVMVYGELNETPDHIKLLKIFDQSLQCTLFDSMWGEKIDFDDPRYRCGGE